MEEGSHAGGTTKNTTAGGRGRGRAAPILPQTKAALPPVLAMQGRGTRLKSIRPSPDLTLGGVKKRAFKPNVPTAPHIRKPKEEVKEELPKQMEKRPQQRNVPRGPNPRAFKPEPLNPSAMAASPFAAGPPAQDKFKKGIGAFDNNIGVDMDVDSLDATMKKKKKTDVDALDPIHPVLLPMEDTIEALPESIKRESQLVPEYYGKEKKFIPEGGLCLIQLPSVLPILQPKEDVPIKQEKKTTPELQEKGFTSTLASVPEGRIGKVQIHKSGKMTLCIGEYTYEIKSATQPTFFEEFLTLSADEKHCFQLGENSRRYICVPTIETLLNQPQS